MMFLREVPPHVLDGVNSGLYKVTGSVVRDVASGKGVAFLQETNILQNSIGMVLGLTSGFMPLEMAVNTFQNAVIISKLNAIQSSLSILQAMQIGTLALSGLNLGVSVAGFAIMNRKLNQIRDQLNAIDQKIDQVTEDRRIDEINDIFAKMEHHLENAQSLSERKDKVIAANLSEKALGEAAKILTRRFKAQLKEMNEESDDTNIVTFSSNRFEQLWTIMNAIKLCHDANFCALLIIDELSTIQNQIESRTQTFLELSQILSVDGLLQPIASKCENYDDYVEKRKVLRPYAERLTEAMRENTLMIGSQSVLVQHLIENNISGPDYLSEIDNENTAPLLIRELK